MTGDTGEREFARQSLMVPGRTRAKTSSTVGYRLPRLAARLLAFVPAELAVIRKRSAEAGSVKCFPLQWPRFAIGIDMRHSTTWLIEQVPDLAEIADTVLAQQRIYV